MKNQSKKRPQRSPTPPIKSRLEVEELGEFFDKTLRNVPPLVHTQRFKGEALRKELQLPPELPPENSN